MSESPFEIAARSSAASKNGSHAEEKPPIEQYDAHPEARDKNRTPSSEYVLERGVPIALEAERAILSSILLDNSSYGEVADQLEVEYFAIDSHRNIYSCIRLLLDNAKPCDFLLLINELERRRVLEAVGGLAYVSSLIDSAMSLTSLKYYVELVVKAAKLRSLINIATKAISEATENRDEADEVIDRAETAILQLRAYDIGNTRAITIGEYASEGMREVLRVVDLANTRKVVGFTYGLSELDDVTTGARAGEITLVAARPGHGKSAFAEQMALENAANNVKTAYFSHEMSRDALFQRALCYRTGVNFLKLRSGQLTQNDLERLAAESKLIEQLPLWIDDTPKLSLAQVLARARMLLAKGVVLFIFDFVQRIRVPGEPDPRLRLNEISDGITAFAKQHMKLGVHCVMLSQLAKYRGDKETPPNENDVKETSNLYEDCHVCKLLYRPRDKNRAPTGLDSINIAKQRNGPTGPIGAKLDGALMRWYWREMKKAVENAAKEDQPKLIEERDRTGDKKED